MNIFSEHLQYLKNEAALLQKNASRPGSGQEAAIARLRRLDSFPTVSIDKSEGLETLQLKHALSVVALENGYASWSELKSALDNAAVKSRLAEIKEQFYPAGSDVHWNIWFPNYKKAKVVLKPGEGFLFPYKNHFFICEAGFVEDLGLSPLLPEWKSIGFDWVHPENVQAWLRLNEMYEKLLKAVPATA